MSHSHLDRSIAAFLNATGGNAARAKLKLIEAARQDHLLLISLTAPYLDGIAAHALRRHGRRSIGPQPAVLSGGTLDFDAVVSTLDRNLGGSTVPRSERGRPAASTNHADALRTLSRAQLNRMLEEKARQRG